MTKTVLKVVSGLITISGLIAVVLVGVNCISTAINMGISSYHEAKRVECIEYGEMTNKEVKFSDTNTCWIKKNNTWEIK